jgi:hypothetical protein
MHNTAIKSSIPIMRSSLNEQDRCQSLPLLQTILKPRAEARKQSHLPRGRQAVAHDDFLHLPRHNKLSMSKKFPQPSTRQKPAILIFMNDAVRVLATEMHWKLMRLFCNAGTLSRRDLLAGSAAAAPS